jgi:hypothetical protein
VSASAQSDPSLTRDEVASICRVSRRTVDRWIAADATILSDPEDRASGIQESKLRALLKLKPNQPLVPLLKPGEIAAIFRVGICRAQRWLHNGDLDSIRLPSENGRGVHRIHPSVVMMLLHREVGSPFDYPLLKSSEIAGMFGVSMHSVCTWGSKGMMGAIRTPGGDHGEWRFHETSVEIAHHYWVMFPGA